MATPIDVPKRFMGRWFVVANIPTYFEVGATNLIEDYIWNEEEQFVQVRVHLHVIFGLAGLIV